jgi:uncharacterized protein involved in high-affinity Fe2+ transport
MEFKLVYDDKIFETIALSGEVQDIATVFWKVSDEIRFQREERPIEFYKLHVAGVIFQPIWEMQQRGQTKIKSNHYIQFLSRPN